jgi:O-antigen/teichoic acid export membrane protein
MIPLAPGRRLTRNLVLMTVAEVLGAGLNVLALVVVARHLGVERFGRYAYVLAFVGIFQLVANAGLVRILVREIAVDGDTAQRQVAEAKSLTWMLSVLAFALIAGAAEFTGPSWELRWATYLAAGAVIATIHAACYAAVFRAFEEMEVTAVGFVAHKVVALGLAVVGVWLHWGLVGMVGLFLLANVFLWVYYFVVLTARHFRPRITLSPGRWRVLLAESVPLGVTELLRKISWQMDILLLTAFGMTEGSGYFAAAYKVIQAFHLLPVTLAQVLFPRLARLAKSEASTLQSATERALAMLLLVAVPLAVALGVAARRVIAVVYGPAFEPASAPLALMSLSLVFLFVTSLCQYVFTALGAQRLYTIAAFGALAANFVVDVALIPSAAHVGASIGKVTGEAVLFVICAVLLYRVNQRVRFVHLAWRPFAAGLAMAALLFVVRDAPLPLFLGGALFSVVVYVGGLVVAGAIPRSDVALVMSTFAPRGRQASQASRVETLDRLRAEGDPPPP